YSHLTTRRCHELDVYAELMPCTSKLADLKLKPRGIILSESLYSMYNNDAPQAASIYTLGIPILGICYGLQEICCNHKGEVAKCDHCEYRLVEFKISRSSESGNSVDALFERLGDQMQVRLDVKLSVMPPDYHVIGQMSTAAYATITHNSKSVYDIQIHPEVTDSPHRKAAHWLICAEYMPMPTKLDNHEEKFIGKEIVHIRRMCGLKGCMIGTVSRGVDSTVATKLMHEAISDGFHAIMVDSATI
ncbi:class I glutamine amidotransferase-like protein, partial [Suillus subaureus]